MEFSVFWELSQKLQNAQPRLQLAVRLAPGQVPQISREFAAQQEFEGNYSGALGHYERAIQEGKHILTRDELSARIEIFRIIKIQVFQLSRCRKGLVSLFQCRQKITNSFDTNKLLLHA